MAMDAFTTLAEPNRRQIVEFLKNGPATVNSVVEALAISQPMASKHLKSLRVAGFVDMSPQGQCRWYALKPKAFLELEDWLKGFQRYWNDELDALEQYLNDNPNENPNGLKEKTK